MRYLPYTALPIRDFPSKMSFLHNSIINLQDKPLMFSIDDDAPCQTFESQPDPDLPLALGNPNLLSVDQFLDSVLYSNLLIHYTD